MATFILYEPYIQPGFFLFLNCLIASIIIILSFYLSESKPYVEKVSAYECGFEPDEDARNVFDVRFYLMAMLFLIFDLEAIFLFPWAISLSFLNETSFFAVIDFIIELFVGYIYAWQIGALDWT